MVDGWVSLEFCAGKGIFYETADALLCEWGLSFGGRNGNLSYWFVLKCDVGRVCGKWIIL